MPANCRTCKHKTENEFFGMCINGREIPAGYDSLIPGWCPLEGDAESRFEMYLAYKRELWQYEKDFHTSDQEVFTWFEEMKAPDFRWIDIFNHNESVGFLIVGFPDGEIDYVLVESYIKPEHRRKGLMSATVEEFARKNPGNYYMYRQPKNTISRLFWEHTLKKINVKALMIETGVDLVEYTFRVQKNNRKECMTIKIKYLADIERIEKTAQGDWIDLRAAETVSLKAGELKAIPLGVAIELPKGCEAHILPRSSTYKNHKVLMANSMVVVDGLYCGDNDQWYFLAIAMANTIINKNDKICQFRIMKNQEPVEFEVCESLNNADNGGIGSTGI